MEFWIIEELTLPPRFISWTANGNFITAAFMRRKSLSRERQKAGN